MIYFYLFFFLNFKNRFISDEEAIYLIFFLFFFKVTNEYTLENKYFYGTNYFSCLLLLDAGSHS